MQDKHSAAAPPFHGHAVVRAAFICAVLGWGMGFYGPPIFLFAVASTTQWPVPLVSAAVTTHFLFGAIVVTFLPRLHARHGVPRITLAGAFTLAAGVLGWATARQHWQLFLAALLSGAGWVAMGAAGINAIITPWFIRNRPAALSKAYNGASVGGMVFAPLWSLLIARFGFQAAAWIVCLCMLATMAWLTRRVFRQTPAGLGQMPDGDAPPPPPDKATALPASGAAAGWPALAGRKLWRNRRFQTLAAAMSLSLFAQSGVISHLYSVLAPQIGTQGAGWSMTLLTTCAMLGRTLFAWALAAASDRRLLNCASYAMQICGSLLMLAGNGPGVQLWCGLILFGAGIGNTISLPPLIAQSDFAPADVARVTALIIAISQALYSFAPLSFSLLLKIPPGSAWLFAAAAILQALAALVLWAGRAKRRDG